VDTIRPGSVKYAQASCGVRCFATARPSVSAFLDERQREGCLGAELLVHGARQHAERVVAREVALDGVGLVAATHVDEGDARALGRRELLLQRLPEALHDARIGLGAAVPG